MRFHVYAIVRSRLNFVDRIKISDLHKKSNLLSLEQRMRKQLLWLMYSMSLDHNNRKIGARNLRSNNKYIFKTDNKIRTTYQCSPYHQGTLLWNELPKDVQFADSVNILDSNTGSLNTKSQHISFH